MAVFCLNMVVSRTVVTGSVRFQISVTVNLVRVRSFHTSFFIAHVLNLFG
jgi:hypothetical protein